MELSGLPRIGRREKTKPKIDSLSRRIQVEVIVEKCGDITQLRVSKLLENEPTALSQQYAHQLQ